MTRLGLTRIVMATARAGMAIARVVNYPGQEIRLNLVVHFPGYHPVQEIHLNLVVHFLSYRPVRSSHSPVALTAGNRLPCPLDFDIASSCWQPIRSVLVAGIVSMLHLLSVMMPFLSFN